MATTIDRGRPRLIVRAIHHYHPDFEAPEDNRPGEWITVQCPFHDDSNASAGINYEMDAFSCLACGAKGNFWTLILQQEGSYAKANRVAEGLASASDRQASPEPKKVGIRDRVTPWS